MKRARGGAAGASRTHGRGATAPRSAAGVLVKLRAAAQPIATVTLWALGVTTIAPARALANSPSESNGPMAAAPVPQQAAAQQPAAPQGPAAAQERAASQTAPADTPLPPADATTAPLSTASPSDVQAANPTATPAAPAGRKGEPVTPVALPTGADKSGVTSKTISAPQGSGTIQGMGESFSAQLSTGIATFNVPFALPAARGGAQPSLGLSYSSSGGAGLAGAGWQVGVPFIARQTDRGVPRYDDKSAWHPEQDRFVFNGGQELVPICTVSGSTCAGALPEEAMPVWANGHQYFRPRVEGSFLRFFWSPDHLTWRVQDKSGVTMELGAPLDGSGHTAGLERNPEKPSEIYRWHLVRQYDTLGSANPSSGNPAPVNVVVYRYFQDAGTAYLSEIFDTPPASAAATAPLSEYAHHTRLAYEARSDPTHSYRSGWRVDQKLRLRRVDVSSKTVTDGSTGARRMVRRYHLAYDATSHTSLLSSVQVEGRCGGDEDDQSVPSETSNGQLPDVTGCKRLPPMEFRYGRVAAYTGDGVAAKPTLPGYEGFDERIRTIVSSPPHSVDEQDTDLYDINSDGLPDVLVTAVGLYGNGHGVFFNGDGGAPDAFGAAQPMSVGGVLGAGANTITLKNLNVAPLDLDGDATIDFLHMPKVKTYAVYSPGKSGAQWSWKGRVVTTASGLDPKIDFGKDTLDTQVMDVNFDGLVDVVVSTGTEMQTFLSLGRYAGGDGQFGQATWTAATKAALSNEPIRTCVPWSSTPIRFSDPDIKLADMNGDGITDIVRVRKGDVRYWPGRGNGFWGTGKRDDCAGGSFGANRHVTMNAGPQYSDVSGDSLRLDDVNGDGLSDLVQVRFTEVDVWLNVDGVGWTQRHIIKNTPPSPSYANRVRLVDVNGSGTRDILWGDGKNYRYIDLQGGERPWLLTRVDNGLGKTTTLSYSTSTAEMLAAEKAGKPWTTRMPTVAHVVKTVVETDNLALFAGNPASHVTEYGYRDPVFEGRQREFRGFRTAQAKRLGDANSPTDISESTFLLGECADEDASDGVDSCAASERWRDHPREALKGLPIISEKRDESGTYLSTEHTRYRLRRLYVGLDGREVRHAFEAQKDVWNYDTGPFQPDESTESMTSVELELALGGTVSAVVTTPVPLRASAGRVQIRSRSVVDGFGNRVEAIADGCISGCPESPEEVITTVSDPIRPDGDPTGWLWRTGESSVEGSSYFLGAQRETTTTYSSTGLALTVTQTLNDTVDLDRFHAASGSVAALPGSASSDGTIVWTNQYDDFGNLTRESGPDGRCRDLGYDEEYEQLATVETVYTGGCDTGGLSTGATYDRGLGLVALVLDMQLQPTQVSYDGFGRTVSITRPHPTDDGEPSDLPSVIIEYLLPDELSVIAGQPMAFSAIRTRTQDGSDHDQNAYREAWAIVDGMGRTRLSLSEADVSAGDGGEWIASEAAHYDAKGAVRAKHLDFFWGSGGSTPFSFPIENLPSAPQATQRFDAFGRSVESRDLDGTATLTSVYHALGADHWDAADLGGAHANTPASERKDGHGRVVSTIERFYEGQTLRLRETATTYLPTGEPHTITRKLVGTSSAVVRWLRYDSLGRMVLNVEPNTTENFDADPTADPTPGTNGIKAWRYAYNDAGDLVATSDARGCGVNFHYDGAGRLLYEDYSPCLATHATYSSPNLGNKTGIEVLYQYDAAPASGEAPDNFFTLSSDFLRGRLVSVQDRASQSVTAFDGRGRAIRHGTRLARPTLTGDADYDLGNRYGETRWYLKDIAFDGADRETLSSTGATVSDLLGAGNASTVATVYSARGTIKSVSGAYGTLVSSVTRDADGLTVADRIDVVRNSKTGVVEKSKKARVVIVIRDRNGRSPSERVRPKPS